MINKTQQQRVSFEKIRSRVARFQVPQHGPIALLSLQLCVLLGSFVFLLLDTDQYPWIGLFLIVAFCEHDSTGTNPRLLAVLLHL